MKKDTYSFKLSLRGSQIESAVDAIDVGNSIVAITIILQEIAKQELGEKTAETLNIQVYGFKKGSFISEFMMFLGDNGDTVVSLLPMIGVDSIKGLMESLVAYFDLKKHLKGSPPKEITQSMTGEVNVINSTGNSIIINKNIYNISINGSINSQTEKLIAPLLKEGGPVEEMAILTGDSTENDQKEITTVGRNEAYCFEDNSELQEIQMTLFGVITKIDMKALSGYLTLSDNRPRVSLIFSRDISHKQIELIHKSSKDRLAVYVKGQAFSTYQSVVKKMLVSEIMEYQQMETFELNND